MKLFAIILILSVCIQCSSLNNDEIESIEKQLEQLTTIDEKRIYLEEIHALDQEVRKNRAEIEVAYGYDSKELYEMTQKMVKIDRLNLMKIELYLEKYGYPTIAQHGEYAIGAPWIVIHHSSNLKAKEKNFRYLYSAYKSGDLKPGSFSFYLERFHRMKFGKRYTLPNPYREKQLIDSLIKRLELRVLTE